jgi:hypothetical protein
LTNQDGNTDNGSCNAQTLSHCNASLFIPPDDLACFCCEEGVVDAIEHVDRLEEDAAVADAIVVVAVSHVLAVDEGGKVFGSEGGRGGNGDEVA